MSDSLAGIETHRGFALQQTHLIIGVRRLQINSRTADSRNESWNFAMTSISKWMSSNNNWSGWGWDDDGLPFLAIRLADGALAKITEGLHHWDWRLATQTIVIRGKLVYVLVLLVRSPTFESTFASPINHYASDAANPLIQCLENGALRVSLHDGSQNVVSFDAPAADEWQQQIDAAASLPPWTDREFSEALGFLPQSPAEIWEKTS